MKHGIKITVSQTVETITEYIHGEDGLPLVFNSVNEALRYFHERNFILILSSRRQMKLFAREADEVCNKCSVGGICYSNRAWWTKRRKTLKKTGECPTFNAIKERENQMFCKEKK
jgi:hypothetical protein